MKLKEKDFIEIEFTARVKDGEIFDSNIKEDLKELDPKTEPKPFVFALGQGMFLKGVEDFLIGKNIGQYEIELAPEKAFGKRDPKLIQRVPAKVFKEHDLRPVPGIVFNFDGRIGKVLTVSGGRVMVDFNNPVAGRDVVYKMKVLKRVDGLNEKVKAINEFLFRRDMKFEVKDKKVIMQVEKEMLKFVEMFKEKFKDILGMELELREIGEKPAEKDVKKSQ